jgi:hypothetical protein
MMIGQKVKHCHHEQHFLSFIFPTLCSHFFRVFSSSQPCSCFSKSLLCSTSLKNVLLFWSLWFFIGLFCFQVSQVSSFFSWVSHKAFFCHANLSVLLISSAIKLTHTSQSSLLCCASFKKALLLSSFHFFISLFSFQVSSFFFRLSHKAFSCHVDLSLLLIFYVIKLLVFFKFLFFSTPHCDNFEIHFFGQILQIVLRIQHGL